MRTNLISLVAGAGLSLAAAVPALAHHSFAAEFDANKPVTIEGTVKEFRWVNPHSWLHINVTKPDGTVEEWAVEGGAPSALLRRGWTRDTLPPGHESDGAGLHVEGRRAARQRARHHVPRRQAAVHRLVGHRRTGRAHRPIDATQRSATRNRGLLSPRFRFRRMSFAVRCRDSSAARRASASASASASRYARSAGSSGSIASRAAR